MQLFFWGILSVRFNTIFNDHLQKIAGQQKISLEDLFGQIQEWYRGYRFVEESLVEEKMYNPTSVLFYLYNTKFLVTTQHPKFESLRNL